MRVLGVTPAEPGFAAARVEPALGGLEWARGVVPSPDGPIRVEAEPGSVRVESPIPIEHHGVRLDAGTHHLRT